MKKSINKKTLLYTHPVFVIGSYDKDDKPNIMAVSWGGICCSSPPCIGISLRKATYTYGNIVKHGAFTVNIPTQSQKYEADFSGVYSGKDVNKFEALGLTPVDGGDVHAPYVKEFPVNLICKVIQVVPIGLHTQFVGEIKEVLADEEYLADNGYPDIEILKPFIYDSGSRSYYGIGEKLMEAFTAK